MATRTDYQRNILDNPVQRAEHFHRYNQRISWFWRAIYGGALLTIIAPIFFGLGDSFLNSLNIIFGILIMFNMVAIFVMEMRIMSQAAESIRSEFQGKTWELLILTGVDTWRLVIGKWLGTITGNIRNILLLYVLRLGALFWGMVYMYLQQDGFRLWSRYYADEYVPAYLSDIRINLQVLLGAAIIMAIFLVLEMMLVASLPLALSLFKTTRKSATWIALGLRIATPIIFMMAIAFLFAGLPVWLGITDYAYDLYSEDVVLIGLGTTFSFADNGILWSLMPLDQMSASNPDRYYRMWNAIGFSQIIGIGLYLLWTGIMLRIAKFAAHQYNVSTPGFIPKSKPKRMIQADPTPSRDKPKVKMSPAKPPQPHQTNLLGIHNPALYRCKVKSYDDALGQLAISVSPINATSPDYILQFQGVSFFTGTMDWTNAKFEVLNDPQLKTFATKQKLNHDTLPVDSKLYAVQSQENRVRIIATDVHITLNNRRNR